MADYAQLGWLDTIVGVGWPTGNWAIVSTVYKLGNNISANGIAINNGGAVPPDFIKAPYTPTADFLNHIGQVGYPSYFGIYRTLPDINPPHTPVTASAIFFKMKGTNPFGLTIVSSPPGSFITMYGTYASIVKGRTLTFADNTGTAPAFVIPALGVVEVGFAGTRSYHVDPKTCLIS